MLHESFKNRKLFMFSVKDTLISTVILTVALLLAFILQCIDTSSITETVAPLILMLAVVLISRFTNGYFYGIAASVIAVFGVNYAFTYPYFEFNVSLSGYPVTFLVMLTVALVVSMLTTRIKQQEKIKAEIQNEKMRSNLLRSVSHDIRTPLTSIVGSASAYLENSEKLDEEKKTELVKNVKFEAQWLIRMVENLLSITRINGESAKIKKQLEAVEEIISDAVIKFRKKFSNVSISVNVPDELLLVPMDAILIEQVISNILENSVTHGITTKNISISVYSKNGFAHFTFSDDGIGIDKQKLDRIFDGLQIDENDKSTDTKRNMGIGLSVCKAIITAHSGYMSAKNTADGGAEFTFSLPVDERNDSNGD